jgi:hypothetical protein
MAIPNMQSRAVVLPNGHGRTIPTANLADETSLSATKTQESLDLGGPCGAMTMTLVVSAASGTSPTNDTIIEHSHDNSTFATLGSFTQATAATSETKTFGPVRRYVRAKSTLGGTSPVFSFTVSGDLDLSFV